MTDAGVDPEARRLRERFRLVARVTRSLREMPADEGSILATIALHLSEAIGDACTLFLVSADGASLTRVAFHERESALANERCASSGEAHAKLDGLPAWARVLEGDLPLVEKSGNHDTLVVAMRAYEVPLGLIVVSRSRATSAPYDEGDCELAQIAADNAALALGCIRARLAERIASAKAAATLEEMRERFHLAAIADASGDAIIGKTIDGIITSWNRGAEKTFGYTADETVGKSMDVLYPETRTSKRPPKQLAPGEVARFEAVRRRKDGTQIHVAVTTSPLCDGAGRVVGLAQISRDITERKRAEDALARANEAALAAKVELEARKQELRFRALAEQSADSLRLRDERLRTVTDIARVGMVVVGVDRRIRYVNRSYAELLRLPSGDLVGKAVPDVLPALYESQIRPRLDRAFQGERVTFELRIPPAGAGDERRYAVSYEPGVEGGEPVVVVVVVDVTERQRALEALARREEQLSLFVAHSPVAIAMFDREMRYLAVSNRWITDHALPGPDVLGRSHYDVSPGMPERWRQVHERALAGAIESNDDDVLVRPDGRIVSIRWEIRPWLTVAGEIGGVVLFFEDISVRKQAETAVRESEERFRELAENIRDVFWITNAAKTTMVYVSPGYEAIWGRLRKDLMARPADWLEAIHPDDRQRIMLAADERRQIAGGYQETYRIVHSDGSIRWIIDRAYPVRNAAGEVVRIVGLASDVTKEKSLEEQFRQAQKMEAVGRLAGGVAHDFNNLLSVVLSYADLLYEDHLPDDPRRADINEIRNAGLAAAELTRQLLQFSRQQVIEPKCIDVNGALAGMRKMVTRLIGEDIALTMTLRASGHVLVDPSGIEQVVMNLVVNARDALPTGGTVRIESADREVDEALASQLGTKPGPYVVLTVADDGSGMDEVTQAHIFEPFFTTKEKGKGTGLGLSTIFGIVTQSGGSVRVQSRPGAGTTFNVFLPRVTSQPEASAPAAAPAMPQGGETILLVEDDDQLRAAARRILQRQGYVIIEAREGVEAIDLCEKHDGVIDLLLTDIIMPHMSGPELARRLAETRPDLRVLCMSGYTEDRIFPHAGAEGRFAFLQKPIQSDALARKVREVLDAPRGG